MTASLLAAGLITLSQDYSKTKFGDITAKDFSNSIYPIDSNATAVVLVDRGHCSLEGNNKGWFSVVNKRFRRVHILNKNGYDIANVTIRLYSDGNDEEKLDKLKATTYNLENGKVVETKLDTKSGVFEDKADKRNKFKKFTFPNIKEGSIIEFEYTTISDFINSLDPWEFQGSYPQLWSEFNFSVPAFFNYTFFTQGYLDYTVKTQSESTGSFNVSVSNGTGPSDRYHFNALNTDYRWAVKDVPALKEENFTSAIKNHIQKIDFQLVEQRDPLAYKRYIESWPQIIGRMMDSEYFGQSLSRDNGWLKEFVNPLLSKEDDAGSKARKIFNWVRDHFTCTSHQALMANQALKTLAKGKNGTVAEINLLLAAMLRYAGLEADPVILSTRSHGVTYSAYPLMNQYNYVIVSTELNGRKLLLDASEPGIGFGYLPLRCYNGSARVINNTAMVLELLPDSLQEVKYTSVFLVNDEKGNLVGSVQQTPGYYESLALRDRIRDKGMEELLKDIRKEFGMEIEIEKFGVDSLKQVDNPIGIHYEFAVKAEKEDILYINPLFGEAQKDNPFKSAERRYPVEMPFAFDETYNLQLEVPAGYKVDELPKSMVVKLNEEGHGIFEYRVSQSGNMISFRSRVKLSRADFAQDEYEMLREFFSLVVKKHGEQIVLKKL